MIGVLVLVAVLMAACAVLWFFAELWGEILTLVAVGTIAYHLLT